VFNPDLSEAKIAWGGSAGFSDDGKYVVTSGAIANRGIFSARYAWRIQDLVMAACARLPQGQRELSPAEQRLYLVDTEPRPVCDGSPLPAGAEHVVGSPAQRDAAIPDGFLTVTQKFDLLWAWVLSETPQVSSA
jgi:hypothetical protein